MLFKNTSKRIMFICASGRGFWVVGNRVEIESHIEPSVVFMYVTICVTGHLIVALADSHLGLKFQAGCLAGIG